jgi:hypothetical protein
MQANADGAAECKRGFMIVDVYLQGFCFEKKKAKILQQKNTFGNQKQDKDVEMRVERRRKTRLRGLEERSAQQKYGCPGVGGVVAWRVRERQP